MNTKQPILANVQSNSRFASGIFLMALLVCLADLVPGSANAQTASATVSHPGGIAVIPVSIVIDDGTTPLIRFGRQPVLLLRESTRWLAVIGIARTTIPGDYIVTSGLGKSDAINYRIRVRPNLDTAVLPNSDPEFIAKLAYDDTRFARLPLKQPGFGKIRNSFSLNFPAMEIETENAGSLISPGDGVIHSVTASGPVGDQVIINHGQGVYSVLSPVYDLRAKVGQDVDQSQILGTTGAMTAGAVSGVRWQLVLNRTLVDPVLLTRWPSPPASD